LTNGALSKKIHRCVLTWAKSFQGHLESWCGGILNPLPLVQWYKGEKEDQTTRAHAFIPYWNQLLMHLTSRL